MKLSISFRKSTPPANRQLIVYYYLLKYEVDGIVGELTFLNHLLNTLCHISLEPNLGKRLDVPNLDLHVITPADDVFPVRRERN